MNFSCLLNWKPQYDCEIDLDGKTRLVMKTDENALMQKVQSIIEYIQDKAGIVPLLEKILSIVSIGIRIHQVTIF